jgi:hypothetical protein
MAKRDKTTNFDYVIIDGERVQVPGYRYNKKGEKDGLESSYGYYKKVKTPWGAMERCFIVTVPSLAGGKDSYASVFKPESNPGVRWSVFQLQESYN